MADNDQQPKLPTPDPEMMAKMNRPLDTSVPYHAINTQAVLQLYQAFDELPMKYARMLLPLVATNIEPLPENFELPGKS